MNSLDNGVSSSDQSRPSKNGVSPSDQSRHTTTTVTEPLRIEDVYNELGGFSWFQIIMTLCIILPEIPAAMIAISPIFTGTRNVPFHCAGIGATNRSRGMEGGELKMVESHVYFGTDSFLCSKDCLMAIPNSQQSIVQEWDLLCDRAWITDVITSIQMFGMMSGSFISSYIADRFGRKNAYFCMSLLMAVFGTASGLVTNVWLFGVVRYFAGIGCGGFYVIYSIYLIEFLTPSWRTISGCVSIWFAGEMLLALAAYFFHPWRTLLIVTSAPALLIFIIYPFIPESPRYLLCHRRTKEAKSVFQMIARLNSRPPPSDDRIEKLQESLWEEERGSDQLLSGSKPGMFQILCNKELRNQICLFMIGWFSCALIYYGITFNTKNLSGDPYLNVLYMAIVDMPSFPSGILFNNWLGRKRTYSYNLVFGATFMVALVAWQEIYGLEQYPNLLTILCYLSRFGVGAAWGVIYCFTAESFPTVVRSTAIGLCSLAANVGGVMAPLLAYAGIVSPMLPYFIFCAVAVFAAILSCLLQETNGKPLKNFVQ